MTITKGCIRRHALSGPRKAAHERPEPPTPSATAPAGTGLAHRFPGAGRIADTTRDIGLAQPPWYLSPRHVRGPDPVPDQIGRAHV